MAESTLGFLAASHISQLELQGPETLNQQAETKELEDKLFASSQRTGKRLKSELPFGNTCLT